MMGNIEITNLICYYIHKLQLEGISMKQQNDKDIFDALNSKVEAFTKCLEKGVDSIVNRIKDFDEEKFERNVSTFFAKIASVFVKIGKSIGKVIAKVFSQLFNSEHRSITLMFIFMLVILLVIAIVATCLNT